MGKVVIFHSRRNLPGTQIFGFLAAEALAPNGRWSAMTKSENKNVVEMHGCIVCARIFNILAVYTPDGRLVLPDPLTDQEVNSIRELASSRPNHS
jgi:hypothetical protein